MRFALDIRAKFHPPVLTAFPLPEVARHNRGIIVTYSLFLFVRCSLHVFLLSFRYVSVNFLPRFALSHHPLRPAIRAARRLAQAGELPNGGDAPPPISTTSKRA